VLIAAQNDFGYRLFLLLHILSIIVAFGPGFVWPVVAARLRKEGQPLGATLSKIQLGNNMRIHGPALVAAGVFGFALIGMSDKEWKFSQSWISIALVLWFVMLGVLFGLLAPAERKASQGDDAAEQRVAMFTGMLHVLLLLMLIDMIWKPGVPGL
jgi:uncharacterized membrane protein